MVVPASRAYQRCRKSADRQVPPAKRASSLRSPPEAAPPSPSDSSVASVRVAETRAPAAGTRRLQPLSLRGPSAPPLKSLAAAARNSWLHAAYSAAAARLPRSPVNVLCGPSVSAQTFHEAARGRSGPGVWEPEAPTDQDVAHWSAARDPWVLGTQAARRNRRKRRTGSRLASPACCLDKRRSCCVGAEPPPRCVTPCGLVCCRQRARARCSERRQHAAREDTRLLRSGRRVAIDDFCGRSGVQDRLGGMTGAPAEPRRGQPMLDSAFAAYFVAR